MKIVKLALMGRVCHERQHSAVCDGDIECAIKGAQRGFGMDAPSKKKSVSKGSGRKRTRAPDQKREALMRAAVAEFAREGYGGARVDRISKAAKSNDRMLYYYFASKEKLFRQVIEYCYADLVSREEALALDFTNPRRALAELVAFNWNYYWEKPELLSILASENLFKGRHVKNNIRGIFADSQLGMLDRILNSGAERGDFKPDCDRVLVFVRIFTHFRVICGSNWENRSAGRHGFRTSR